ncbi:phospholipase a(1) lcat3 [Phtheirospermum japonicum]|uniref:Phospholipase a(1) lcat3 n=1 Tax=Phtheirospermum japonicum TaxID=374723 RepID=A0A830C943_9LAMI|nr:phospholipase a(1) lcat3 [Phtheirospermum japonicum]
MLRYYCCCCHGFRSSDPPDVADRDPVLLVSGIGGSILNSKRKKVGFETRVWVRILLADLEFKKKLWSIYNPETGYTEPLDDSTEIIVPQDNYGLYAIDILDPSIFVKCLHLTDVYHFHEMIGMLVGCGYKKGTTLFGYGYDFRQSAPGCINDSMLTGMQFVEGFESYFFVSRWSMHQLLVECPSVYEMLSNPNFNWKKQPEIKLNHDGKTVALPFNFAILKWPAGTRKIIDKTQLPEGFLSTTYTERRLTHLLMFGCYGSESSPIDELSEICHTMVSNFCMSDCQPKYSYVDGDGTVPSESAKADSFDAVERVGVIASHRGLLADEKVFQLIQNWLGVSPKAKVKHSKTSKVMDANINRLNDL